MHRIVLLAVLGTLAAVAGSHLLITAKHSIAAADSAARLLHCDAAALNRDDGADSTDPTAACAGIAKRLEAETGAGVAAVVPAAPGQ